MVPQWVRLGIWLVGSGQIAVDTVADAGSGGLAGITGEVGIAGCRLNLRVAELLFHHRQPLAEHQRGRGKGMAQAVNVSVVWSAACPHSPNGMVAVGQIAPPLSANEDPAVVVVLLDAKLGSMRGSPSWTTSVLLPRSATFISRIESRRIKVPAPICRLAKSVAAFREATIDVQPVLFLGEQTVQSTLRTYETELPTLENGNTVKQQS